MAGGISEQIVFDPGMVWCFIIKPLEQEISKWSWDYFIVLQTLI